MDVASRTRGAKSIAVLRSILSGVFLWAFFDKLFGLGFATAKNAAWIRGGSPTEGFLTHGVDAANPFVGQFTALAGQMWVDWLFMAGLLGLGIALLFGIGLRIAAVSGSVLMLLMWVAAWPLANNPLVDEHIVYAAAFWVIASTSPALSVAKWWRNHTGKWLW